MSANDNEDPTVPGGAFPDDELGAEDRTVPSQDAGKQDAGKQDAGKQKPGKQEPGQRDAGQQGADRQPAGEPPPVEDKTAPAMDRDALRAGSGDLIGQTLGGCRVDRMLGRGAMGAVYKARQLKLDRDVAVKVIRPEMMTDPRMLKRFEVEARTVGKFNSAHVVMVHDVGFELGVHYLVMEFVQGKNLREHVKLLAGGRLPAGEALPLIRQACKGLEEARRLGVVHRDIKPDNLMLTEQGILKIADFGIAKPVQDDFSMTLTSELIGTPLYMSPEQCQGGADVDFRSDMYSLGATFFYLLTGEPPIRASSVYELIQTKTKLENLCLWKSLPELDENHPLSRVIERMTANDREDRYESYEELLNDLVLVEAGQTISAPAKKAKKPAGGGRGAAGDAKKGSGALVAVLAVLVLAGAGGGYWWWSQQPGDGAGEVEAAGPRAGGGVSPADLADARAELAALRAQLRDSGPGGTLLDSVKRLEVPAVMADTVTRLELDIKSARGVEARLLKVERPDPPTLPFDDVQAFVQGVERAAELPEDAGPEARAWVARRRDEVGDVAALGAAAIAELRDAFQNWRDEREQVAGDEARLAALGTSLQTIQAARRRLYDLLPKQRSALDERVAQADLDKARLGLQAGAGPMQPGDVDIDASLAAIRAEFVAKGPERSLILSCEKLQPVSPEDLAKRNALLDELRRAETQKRTAENTNDIYPNRPQPPEFRDVDRYFQAIDRPLDELAVEGELPPWAADLRQRLRREQELERGVVRACEDLWLAWRQSQQAGAAAAKLARDKAGLERAMARAVELFPGAAEALAAAVPQAELVAGMARAEAAEAAARWRADLARANQELGSVLSIAAWQPVAAELTATGEALRSSLDQLADKASLEPQLRAFEGGCGKWRSAQVALQQAAELFGRGDLTACENAINRATIGSEGRAELMELKGIVTACREAFEVLEKTLDVREAQQRLDQASTALASSTVLPGDVATQLKAWQDSLTKLQTAASGMVPIAAAGRVGAFFLAATECSRGEFEAFQRRVQTLVEAEGQGALRRRLPDVPLTDAQIDELIRFRSTGDDNRAIERVRWNEALACCRFDGKDLPTRDEWVLAAFGENRANTYSWGNDWSNQKQDRNPNRNQAAVVDDGGLSWRSTDGATLHHLSGNVAEWLAGGADGRAEVAGGRYNQGMGATAKEHANGTRFEELNTSERRTGVGFRAVLRPKDYGDLRWPK